MLRLSKMTDYGLILLSHFARQQDAVLTARGLSERSRIPLPTVSRILKKLAGAGLLASQRGVSGGYYLTRPAEKISIADVVTAFDGSVALTACAERPKSCSLESMCSLRSNLKAIHEATVLVFKNISLAQLSVPFPKGWTFATAEAKALL